MPRQRPRRVLPPRRYGLYVAVAALIVVAYAVLVPWSFANPDYRQDGPLAYTGPTLGADVRLEGNGLSASAVAAKEDEEYGTCDDDSTLVVKGGRVGGRAYFAVFDVGADGDVCMVTIRDGVSGSDLDVDGDGGVDITRVLKDGGAWPWFGAVNTSEEVWLGLAASVAGVLFCGVLSRRDIVRIAFEADGWIPWVVYRALGVLLALVFFIVHIDVLPWPDRTGYVALGLLDAAWAWGLAGGTLLLSPTFRGPARSSRVVTRARGAWVTIGTMFGRLGRLPRWRRPVERAAVAGPTTQAATSSPPSKVARFRVTPTSGLPHFGDVGGMPEVKAQLEDSVGLLLAFADEAEDYRITFNGILLHGPPGTGKTYLAKAVAGEFGLSFVHVTAADLVSKYVGETARNVEAAFETAAANVPSMLFFDEFDAIAGRRDDDASAEDRRAVAQLLTSLERHRQLRDLIVFAATNDLERLDRAVVRPGRFDRHVRIDLPDADGREAILRACMSGRPAFHHTDFSEVVRRTEGCSAATLASLVETASLAAFRQATATGQQIRIGSSHLLAALESRGGQDRPTVERWDWDALVLPAAVKEELQQVQALVEDPERARAYGVRPPSGMLLAGPPGTGKTTIARVLAAQARCSFYPVTVADLTSKWVGESEDTVVRLFARARENSPSLVFLDEIDAIAGRRTSGGSGYENRLINQLLAEIDGLGGRGDVFVLAATNRPDSLDPALVRGGRLSRTVWIPLPDDDGRRALVKLHAARMPLAPDVDLDAVAAATEGWSGADLEALCQQAAVVAMTRAGRSHRPEGRPQVQAADFRGAVDTMAKARRSPAAGSMTRRDHVVPPPGLGGS